MSDEGLQQARDKMAADDVDPTAIEVFSHYYKLVESGETGMIREADIEPLDMDALADVEVSDDDAVAALGRTVVVKLNGGLGTSMGLAAAKTLLEVRDGLTFLDVIARQVLALRKRHDVRLPLLFMNSFRTRDDTLEALAPYADLPDADLPLDFLQNKEPKLLAEDLTPVSWPDDPTLEWCPPGHGDLYTALRGTGLLDAMIEAGFTQVFVSNSDNLGAVPDPRSRAGSPRAVRPSPSRPYAVRRATARAGTSPDAPATTASCCARPPRPRTRTRRRWPTWSGTASPPPTTCGSTWPR